jgi:hypothetical protein
MSVNVGGWLQGWTIGPQGLVRHRCDVWVFVFAEIDVPGPEIFVT